MSEIFYFDMSKKGTDLLGIKDINVLKNVNAVKESIHNLFMTDVGTRLMHPEYGVNLSKYMFEPLDIFTAELMEYDLKVALDKFEDRITDINISVEPREDEMLYIININFRVIVTNTQETIQIKFSKIR